MIDEKALAVAVLAAPGTTIEDCRAIAEPIVRAYLQALSPGSTGETDGWVLVPREPTLAMCNAGWREIDKQGFQTEDTEVAPIYRAMLAAAGGRDE